MPEILIVIVVIWVVSGAVGYAYARLRGPHDDPPSGPNSEWSDICHRGY